MVDGVVGAGAFFSLVTGALPGAVFGAVFVGAAGVSGTAGFAEDAGALFAGGAVTGVGTKV